MVVVLHRASDEQCCDGGRAMCLLESHRDSCCESPVGQWVLGYSVECFRSYGKKIPASCLAGEGGMVEESIYIRHCGHLVQSKSRQIANINSTPNDPSKDCSLVLSEKADDLRGGRMPPYGASFFPLGSRPGWVSHTENYLLVCSSNSQFLITTQHIRMWVLRVLPVSRLSPNSV